MKSAPGFESRQLLNVAEIAPALDDRCILVGTTGCGKTTLAHALLGSRRHVLVLDTKGSIRWPGYRRFTRLNKVMNAARQGTERIVYAPALDELNFDYYELFFEYAYRRRNCTVYVDEVMEVSRGVNYPYFYRGCLTRGRERNVSVFSATQRPQSIPVEIRSESEHYYVFYCRHARDREAIEASTTLSRLTQSELPDKLFYHCDDSRAVEGPYKLSLGGTP